MEGVRQITLTCIAQVNVMLENGLLRGALGDAYVKKVYPVDFFETYDRVRIVVSFCEVSLACKLTW